MAVFDRRDEGFHHFGVDEITVEEVQFVQTEFIASIAEVRGVRWTATQITKYPTSKNEILASAARTEAEFITERKAAILPVWPPPPKGLMAAVR